MRTAETNSRIEAELLRADQARASGLEGQARVCARRAAGIAVRIYLEEHGEIVPGPSVMDALEVFRSRPEISERMRTVTSHLLSRVNQNYALDFDSDLIAETRWLVEALDTFD